ncbi:MAG: LysE family translocator [Bacteroidales bacterium]|nr:LysE family translocator [Bacteroidales bacterium]
MFEGIQNYGAFIIAGIILNLTPGADTIYILTRSVSQGKQAGTVSILGIVTGCLFHICFAAFGLSIILAQSALAFNIVRIAGGLYLVFLGIKAFISRSGNFSVTERKNNKSSLIKIYRQGMFTNLLNPKVALFFLSFLPQFIVPEFTSGPFPFLILGFTFLTTGTIWCFFLAVTASYMTNTLQNNPRIAFWMQKISGGIFITLGFNLILRKS